MNFIQFKKLLLITLFSCIFTLSQSAIAAGDLSVTKSIELDAAPTTVWKMIGGFNHLDVWHPVVTGSELQGKGMKPGDIRVLSLANGASITEKLIAHSDEQKTYTYAITESPLPVKDYVSTITVSTASDGKSQVEWRSTFNANDAPDSKAVETITGIYDAGLNTLAKHFNP